MIERHVSLLCEVTFVRAARCIIVEYFTENTFIINTYTKGKRFAPEP